MQITQIQAVRINWPEREEKTPPRETFVLQRGIYNKYGDKVQRALPAVLPPLPKGQPNDVLLSMGQLVITSPVERVGYEHVVSLGHVVAPEVSESVLVGHLHSVAGGVAFYTAPPRLFDGKDHFSAGFFEPSGAFPEHIP